MLIHTFPNVISVNDFGELPYIGISIKTLNGVDLISFTSFRASDDQGKARQKSTPEENDIAQNMEWIVQKWNGVAYDGVPVLNENVLHEINKMTTRHVDKGCLSGIPVGVGTERNEEMHK